MSLRFLARMASVQLPCEIRSPGDLLHVEVLHDAKLIIATLSSPDRYLVGRFGIVHSITPAGFEMAKTKRETPGGD